MALLDFTADTILGVVIISAAVIVVFGMIFVFSSGSSSTLCGIAVNARGKAMENGNVAYDVAVTGGNVVDASTAASTWVGATTDQELQFPWPLICKLNEVDSGSTGAKTFATNLASTALSDWQTLGANKYRLLVNDEDPKHLNAKKMSVLHANFVDEFTPNQFFDALEGEIFEGKETKISDFLPREKVHFLSNGKYIDDLSEGITGDTIFTIYYVDRVTGGVAAVTGQDEWEDYISPNELVGGTTNFFGLGVINAPECGIYGGFPSDSQMESYVSDHCGFSEWLSGIVERNEDTYCDCLYETTKMPSCSFQMMSDEIWICVQGTNVPDYSSADTTPPETIGYEVCSPDGELEDCVDISGADGIYSFHTELVDPIIRGKISGAYTITITNEAGATISQPDVIYGGCEQDDCFYFEMPTPPVEEWVNYIVELKDISLNFASDEISVFRSPATTATIDATDYVNSKVDIKITLSDSIKKMGISVSNGERMPDPIFMENLNAGDYSVSFDGFTIEDEGEWTISINGIDSEGEEIVHVGEKSFIVDWTINDVSGDDFEFTQTTGYTRGENPSVDNYEDDFYIAYNNDESGELEVYIVESE